MMNKHRKSAFPGIAYLTATLVGVLLFLILGEPVFGVKPNFAWVAWLAGFLFSLSILWVWLRWRNP